MLEARPEVAVVGLVMPPVVAEGLVVGVEDRPVLVGGDRPELETVGEGVLGSLRRAGLVAAAPPSAWTDKDGRPANLTSSAAR